MPCAFRCGSLLAGAALAFAGARLTAATSEADAFPTYTNYIRITGQTPWVEGNQAAFQNRTRTPAEGGAGIEDLHIEKNLSKDADLEVNGHALTGAEDYLASLEVTKADVGSYEVGYKRFRVFYDGAGGFFPLNRAWMPLTNQDLHTDRGLFWAEAKVALPDKPALRLRYESMLRTGTKDSLHWGDTDFTGLPNNNSPISQVRKIVPSFRKLRERHDSLEFTVSQTVGKTAYVVTLEGEGTRNFDTRYVTRFPGEAKLFPAPAATVLVPAANMNNQIVQAQSDGMDTSSFKATGTTRTVITPKVTLRTGLSYELENTDFTGDRPLVTSTPTATGVVDVATDNYRGLAGGTVIKVYAGNIIFDLKPVKALEIHVGVRGEDKYTRGTGTYNVVAATGTPAVTLTTTPRYEYARVKEHSLTPDIDVRLAATPNLTLYTTANWRSLAGDERNSSAYNPLTALQGTVANNNLSEEHGNYALGATWRQSAYLTLRTEAFLKDHQYGSIAYGVNFGDRYVRDGRTQGVKVTVQAKPLATVSATTRYIYQLGRMQVTGFLPTTPKYDSMRATSHTLDETIDWNPCQQFYLQANANLVYNVISTVYPRAGITPATSTAVAFDTNGVLQNSNNNYFNGSLVAGCALTKRDDLQVQYTYYRAANGNPSLANLTLPYGVSALDYSATVGLKHKVSDRMLVSAKAGYVSSRNDTTGGNTNFHAPMAYVSVEYGL